MKIRMVENVDIEKLIKVNQFYQFIILVKQKLELFENRMFKE